MEDDKTNEIKDIKTNNKGEKKEEETFDSKIDSFLYQLNEINNILKKEDEELNKKNLEKIEEEKKEKERILQESLKKKSIMFLEKFAKNLENSKINFINIGGSSCYQSSTFQGFVHVIYPTAIKNIISNIEQNKYKTINNIDELKNDNEFNRMFIDILKDINNLQEKGEGSNGYLAKDIFNKYPPKLEFGEGIGNILDINILHFNLEINSMNLIYLIEAFKKSNLFNTYNSNSIEVINIDRNTIITEVMKLKIEGNRQFCGNIVLKFDKNDINDNNLDIIKLLKKCKQLYIDGNSTKKIELISDIIYLVIDRLSDKESSKKEININEYIYFNEEKGNFDSIRGNKDLTYEPKFIIYHLGYHYIAYCKIENKWYYFNDMSSSFASESNPPLKGEKGSNTYPVAIYYVKKK